jgi:hypothetical protein
MGKTVYPTGTDVADVLTAAGIALGTLDTTTAAAAGTADFERRVGRKMLAPAGTLTRYYPPPTNREGYLDLERDLATCTQVQYQPEGATAETLVLDTDYWLLPLNARSDDPPQPWSGIEFARRWTEWPGAAQSQAWHRAIRVTGRWGYHTEIPDDAWLAMVYRAVSLLSPQAGSALSAGRQEYSQSGVSYTVWGTAAYLELRRTGEWWLKDAVARYRRMRL